MSRCRRAKNSCPRILKNSTYYSVSTSNCEKMASTFRLSISGYEGWNLCFLIGTIYLFLQKLESGVGFAPTIYDFADRCLGLLGQPDGHSCKVESRILLTVKNHSLSELLAGNVDKIISTSISEFHRANECFSASLQFAYCSK